MILLKHYFIRQHQIKMQARFLVFCWRRAAKRSVRVNSTYCSNCYNVQIRSISVKSLFPQSNTKRNAICLARERRINRISETNNLRLEFTYVQHFSRTGIQTDIHVRIRELQYMYFNTKKTALSRGSRTDRPRYHPC